MRQNLIEKDCPADAPTPKQLAFLRRGQVTARLCAMHGANIPLCHVHHTYVVVLVDQLPTDEGEQLLNDPPCLVG